MFSEVVFVCFTYVGGRSFVGPRTGEGDEFMTALMDHKTAHCGGREEKESVTSGFFAMLKKKQKNPNTATQAAIKRDESICQLCGVSHCTRGYSYFSSSHLFLLSSPCLYLVFMASV